ncbi:MAG TPA: DNA internalization-related competence protein ComEC/Rec2, partial [Rubricoccaceae bacterium]
DRVRLAGTLAAPAPRRNPADMDYGAYLRGQGVGATLRVESEGDVVFLRPGRGFSDRLALGVQRHVRRAVARHVPGDEARAVVLALLVADWSEIEDPTVDGFRETGLLHLLSVSGLHLVFVGLALYALLGPVLGRLRVPRHQRECARTAVTLAVMFVYVVAAGSSAPVVRAFVMAAVLVVGRASERRVDTLNGLGLAALGLLFWRPTVLFEAGFQLSFGAVAALVACGPVVTAGLPEAWGRSSAGRAVTGSLVASVVATLGTAPILLAWFGLLPLSGLLLNLPAIPLTSAALGGGLGASVCAGWWPAGADLFGAFASACVRALLVVSTFGAERMGGVTVERFVTDPLTLAAMASLVAAVALWPRVVARRRLVLAAVGLLAVGAWASVARGDARPTLDAVFLDVGQGDATLLRLPGGQTILIDAGDRTDRRDEGLRTVVPHLARYGVHHLDALVVTHPHADHIGGAVSVMGAVSVGRLVHNGQADGSTMWRQTLRVADSLGVTTQGVRAGDTLRLDPAVRVRVLGPSRELAQAGEANEASVVLLVEYGTTRWLLAGDAETAAEADVLARYAGLLQADVVKVGHHGSRTSSSLPFVAAASGVPPGTSLVSARVRETAPDYAVVSVGRRNRHGLPDEEPVTRWLVAGANVLQTADQGAVWLRSDGERVERLDWRGDGR